MWVTDCKGGTTVIATASNTDNDPPPNADVLANTGREPKAKDTRRRADQPRQPDGFRPGQDPTALAPPAPIPQQDFAPPAPRRAPVQSFFPSRAQPNYVPQPLDPAGR